MDSKYFELCGKLVVGGFGGVALVLALAFFVWLSGWAFYGAVKSAMKGFGFWPVFLQMKQTHRSWATWAATLCREDREVRDGFGSVIDLEALRKFFVRYDPDNDYKWQRP